MSLDNLKSFDPFAETDGGDDKKDYIHIRIQQRNGRKTLTTIQGLPKEIDPKRVLKFAKKEFATNGSIVNDTELGEVIQLQGDQRQKISDLMVASMGIKKSNIKIHGFWIHDNFRPLRDNNDLFASLQLLYQTLIPRNRRNHANRQPNDIVMRIAL